MKKIALSSIFLALLLGAFFLGKKQEGGKLAEKSGKVTPQVEGEQQETTFSPPKSKKPTIKFFVMSFCPYGNQAEAGLEPVYQLLKDKVDWQPRYIVADQKNSCEKNCPFRVFNEEAKARCQAAIDQGKLENMEACRTYFPYDSSEECLKKECQNLAAGIYQSLHGEQELNQDLREICAFNLGKPEAWWKFVLQVNEKCNSTNADSCWLPLAKQAGLDADKISACEKNQKKQLLDKEIEESEKYKAFGSPTVYINETLYQERRTPEAYKQAICAAFDVVPTECNEKLADDSGAVGGGCR